MLLEICIDSFQSAAAAKAGGADRLEVCSSLAAGGTTPSYALVEQCVVDLKMPVMMMIRPHDGGFVYDEADVETMKRDIEIAKSIGVQGIVLGALTSERMIDHETCGRLIDAAAALEVTFHRAFDLVPNPLAAVEELETLGFHRVLTSGQQRTALAGAELIAGLTERAASLCILAGGGVNADNARQLVERTGVQEVHGSASVLANDGQSLGNVSFGTQRRVTNAAQVRAIQTAIASP
ncbi:copper homeostasis protein CutC [Allorhodopirellula solitaria]|uniref:PF03932 family protein CutC n=1 Tax=Allorhodopirellula solitaria TaxID=2527987 RepID=A0A5C5X8X6_9BACT|nr:copper homeostasis protein CutC [Allorhodopirellula solitaria]TWT59288.1 Copper homeostasis protein CutC [Allorhodopirellula solitaria]